MCYYTNRVFIKLSGHAILYRINIRNANVIIFLKKKSGHRIPSLNIYIGARLLRDVWLQTKETVFNLRIGGITGGKTTPHIVNIQRRKFNIKQGGCCYCHCSCWCCICRSRIQDIFLEGGTFQISDKCSYLVFSVIFLSFYERYVVFDLMGSKNWIWPINISLVRHNSRNGIDLTAFYHEYLIGPAFVTAVVNTCYYFRKQNIKRPVSLDFSDCVKPFFFKLFTYYI